MSTISLAADLSSDGDSIAVMHLTGLKVYSTDSYIAKAKLGDPVTDSCPIAFGHGASAVLCGGLSGTAKLYSLSGETFATFKVGGAS